MIRNAPIIMAFLKNLMIFLTEEKFSGIHEYFEN